MAARGAREMVVVPAQLRERSWRPRGRVQRVPMRLYDFMLAKHLDVPRPDPLGLVESTAIDRIGAGLALFRGMDEAARQEQLARGVAPTDVVLPYDVPRRWNRLKMPDYVPPWDALPEFPWDAVYAYHAGEPERGIPGVGFHRYEHVRKFLLWVAARDSLLKEDGTAPAFICQKWDREKAKREARERGELEAVDPSEKHLRAHDVQAILISWPHVNDLRQGKMWLDVAERARALYNDLKLHVHAFVGRVAGPRPTEWATLRWEMVDWQQNVIRGWPQPKKHFAPRTIRFAEPWALRDPEPLYAPDGRRLWRYPNLEFLASVVRPLVCGIPDLVGPVILTDHGEPYKIPKRGTSPVADFIGTGFRRVLGEDAPSAHALRRLDATERARLCTPLELIAAHLDDTVAVVDRHYLDKDRLHDDGYDLSWYAANQGNSLVGVKAMAPVPLPDLSGWRSGWESSTIQALYRDALALATNRRRAVEPKLPGSAPAGI